MQTGTTPARRIATEPASGRSARITGACQAATSATLQTRPPAAGEELWAGSSEVMA